MYWVLMLILSLIVPILMVVFGYIFGKEIPTMGESKLAYKSKRANLSKMTWSFAHKNMGNAWFITGAIFLPTSIAIMLLFRDSDIRPVLIAGISVTASETIVMLIEMGIIELLLKYRFDEQGNRK